MIRKRDKNLSTTLHIKYKISKKDKYTNANKCHQNQAEKVIDNEWGEGTCLSNKDKRYRVRKAVMEVLQLCSGKLVVKAVDILHFTIANLKKATTAANVYFDEFAIISQQKSKDHKLFQQMVLRAGPYKQPTSASFINKRAQN